MSRRKRGATEISLFPFLGVLLCVIGVLIMIIVGASLAMVDPPSISPDEMDSLSNSKQELENQILIKKSILKNSLDKLREITTYKNHVVQLNDNIGDQKKRNVDLKNQLKHLLKEIEQMKLSLNKKKKKKLNRNQKLAVPKRFKGKSKFHPVLVDCLEDSVVFLQSNEKISKDDIDDSLYIHTVFSDIKKSNKWCLVMIVREKGVKTFDSIHAKAKKMKIPYGFWPIIGNKKYDVRHWKTAGFLNRKP